MPPTASELFFRPTIDSVTFNDDVLGRLKSSIGVDFVKTLNNLYINKKLDQYSSSAPTLTGDAYGKGLLYMVCLSPLGKVEQTVQLASSNGDKGYLTDMGHDFMKAVYAEFTVRGPNDPSVPANSIINKGSNEPVCDVMSKEIDTTIIAVPRSAAYDPSNITPSNYTIGDAANLYKQMFLSQLSVMLDGASTPIRKGIHKFHYKALASGGPTGDWETDMLQELNPQMFMGSGYFLQDYLWIVILNSVYKFYNGDITIDIFKKNKNFFHSLLLNYFFQVLTYHIEMNVRRDITLHTPERTSHVIQSLYVLGHLFFFGIDSSSYNIQVTFGKPESSVTKVTGKKDFDALSDEEIGHIVRMIGSVRKDLGLQKLKDINGTKSSKYVPAQPHCANTIRKLPIKDKFNLGQVTPRGAAHSDAFEEVIHMLFEGLKAALLQEGITLDDESEVWVWMMVKYMGDQGHVTNMDMCEIFYLFHCWYRGQVSSSGGPIYVKELSEHIKDFSQEILQTTGTLVSLDTLLHSTAMFKYGICADIASKYFEVCGNPNLIAFYNAHKKDSIIMKVNEMSALFSKRDRLQSCCNFEFIPVISDGYPDLNDLKNGYRTLVKKKLDDAGLLKDDKIISPTDATDNFKTIFGDATIKTFLDLIELCKGVQSILTLTPKDVEHICKTLHEIFSFMINPKVTSRKWTSPNLFEYKGQTDEDETMESKVASLDELIVGPQFFAQLSEYITTIDTLMKADQLGNESHFASIMKVITDKCNAHIQICVESPLIVDLFLAPAASDNGKKIEKNEKLIGFAYMVYICCQIGFRSEEDEYKQLLKKYYAANPSEDPKKVTVKAKKGAGKPLATITNTYANTAPGKKGPSKKSAQPPLPAQPQPLPAQPLSAQPALTATNAPGKKGPSKKSLVQQALAATQPALAATQPALAATQPALAATKAPAKKAAAKALPMAKPTPPAEWYTDNKIDLNLFSQRVKPVITSLDNKELFKKSIGLFKDILKMLFSVKEFNWQNSKTLRKKKSDWETNSFSKFFSTSNGNIFIEEMPTPKIMKDTLSGIVFTPNRYHDNVVISELYEQYIPYEYNRLLKEKYENKEGGGRNSQTGGEPPRVKELYERHVNTIGNCSHFLGTRNKLDSYYQLYHFYIDMNKSVTDEKNMNDLIEQKKNDYRWVKYYELIRHLGLYVNKGNGSISQLFSKEIEDVVHEGLLAEKINELEEELIDLEVDFTQLSDDDTYNKNNLIWSQNEELKGIVEQIIRTFNPKTFQYEIVFTDYRNKQIVNKSNHEWQRILKQGGLKQEEVEQLKDMIVYRASYDMLREGCSSENKFLLFFREHEWYSIVREMTRYMDESSEEESDSPYQASEEKDSIQTDLSAKSIDDLARLIPQSDIEKIIDSATYHEYIDAKQNVYTLQQQKLGGRKLSSDEEEMYSIALQDMKNKEGPLRKELMKYVPQLGGKYKCEPLFFNYEELNNEYNKLITNDKLNDRLEQLYNTYGDEVKSRILLSYPENVPMIPDIGDTFTYNEYDGVEHTDSIEDENMDDLDKDDLGLFYHYYYQSELVQKELYNAHSKLSGYIFNLKRMYPDYDIPDITNYERDKKEYVKHYAINTIFKKCDDIRSNKTMIVADRTMIDERANVEATRDTFAAEMADRDADRVRLAAESVARQAADEAARINEARRRERLSASAVGIDTRFPPLKQQVVPEVKTSTREKEWREISNATKQSRKILNQRRFGGTRKKSTFHGGAFTIRPKEYVRGDEFLERLQDCVLFGAGQRDLDVVENKRLPRNESHDLLTRIQRFRQYNNHNGGNSDYDTIDSLLKNIEFNVINLDLLYKRKMVYLAKCIHHLLNFLNKIQQNINAFILNQRQVNAEPFIDYTKMVDMFMCYVAIYNSAIPDSHYEKMYETITTGVYDTDTSTYDTTYNSYTMSPNDYIYMSDLRGDYFMYKSENDKDSLSKTKERYDDFVIDRFVQFYNPSVQPDWSIIPNMYWYGYDPSMLAYFEYIYEQEMLQTMAVQSTQVYSEPQSTQVYSEPQSTQVLSPAQSTQVLSPAQSPPELQRAVGVFGGKRSRRKNKKTRRKRTRKH
jgi:hypothetical protein